MPIYMKAGTDIKGEVTATGYIDEIELTSLQVGVGIGVASPSGGGGKRTHSAASFSEVTASKAFDNASGLIFDKLAAGTAVPEVVITFVRASGKDKAGNDKYLTITLSDVLFSGWSMSSGGEMPSESVSLNYGKIKIDYMKSDKDGVLTQGTIAGWDLATNISAA